MNVVYGDITRQKADAIVNAANGYVGCMGAGVAGAIRRVGGHQIESEARALCRQTKHEPGSVYVTSAGQLDAKYVIHAVTMRYPAERCSVETVAKCIESIFAKAKELGCASVVIPGLGTKIGRAPLDRIAELYLSAIPRLERETGIRATVCDIDADLIKLLTKI